MARKGKKQNRSRHGNRRKNRGAGILAPRGAAHPLSDLRPFSNAGIGLPATQVVRLRYCELLAPTSTVGALANYIFAANGLYDPNITGTGHQPYGFDQWMALYTHALVVRSRIDVESSATSTDMTVGVTFAQSDPTGTLSSAQYLAETGRGTTVQVTSGQGGMCRHVESTFDIRRTDPKYDPAQMWSTSAANPTNTYVFCLFAQSTDLATTSSALCTVMIEYEVILMDPVTVINS